MSYRVNLLMSDTGGGHRASAEAIREALQLTYGDRVSVVLIDGLLEYTPYPFRRFPAWYPTIIARGVRVWKPGYRLTDGARRTRALTRAVWPYVRRGIRRMLAEHPADVIVAMHPFLVRPVLHGLGGNRPPFITVVTDMVSTHALWFDARADLTLVPTQMARRHALECRIPPERVRVVGLPVSQRFCDPTGDRLALRQNLGWQPDLTALLLLGGGEGMGPLGDIARCLARADLPIQLAIVCGRNEQLRAELARNVWSLPVYVYGFVANMPELMAAADLVVTKAGPSTVMETLNCGRPLVLSGAIPGQEEGNVAYVVENGAGLWAPGPEKVVAAVRRLLAGGPDSLARAAVNARRLARPEAARLIARDIGRYIGAAPITVDDVAASNC